MSLLACVLAIAASTLFVWWGSVALDHTSERLASHYEIPSGAQGAILTAVGSSFPELSTVVLATWFHGAFDLGVSAIVGSAVFNVLVIPALAALFGAPLRFERDVLYRDAHFYLLAIAVLLLTFAFARIQHPVGEADLAGLVTRPLALLPLSLYGLYLFLHHQDREDQRVVEAETSGESTVGSEWRRLGVSLILIIVGVEGLVRSALWLGDRFAIPSFLWGATVVAAATSLPDALVSIRSARRGDADVSLANVFGSNSFDLLVAVPVGVLVAGSAAIRLDVALPMIAFLALATVLVFAVLRSHLALGARGAAWLLALYGGFVAWFAWSGSAAAGGA